MKHISPNNLIPLNAYRKEHPIAIDLVYAQKGHPENHFPNLYHPQSKILWVEKDLAVITLIAAHMCKKLYGWKLVALDCLRPVEAQQGMEQYGYHPSLVSLPGSGAHPRAMAIDLLPLDEHGNKIDMGTPFDFFVEDPTADNPAARHYTKFQAPWKEAEAIWLNRQKLEFAVRYAATLHNKIIMPLPQEWWDFRFEAEESNSYYPIFESELYPYQRLLSPDIDKMEEILAGRYPAELVNAMDYVSEAVTSHLKHIG